LPSSPPIGISSLHYKWNGFEDAFARAHDEMGLAFIEFSTNEFQTEDDWREAGEIARRRSVQTTLHAWSDWAATAPDEAVAEGRELARKMETIGARALIIHAGTWAERDEGVNRLVRVLRRLAPVYEAAGRIILIENHYSFETHQELGGRPDEMMRILMDAASPALRFCLDHGHSHMTGNTMEFIDKLIPFWSYAHIADNRGEHDDHLPPGEGTVDWESVLGASRDAGFAGELLIEFPEGDGVERLKELVGQVWAG